MNAAVSKPWQTMREEGMERLIMKKYSEVAEAHRPEDIHHEIGLEAILGAVSGLAGNKKGKRRKSFTQVQLLPADGGI